MKKTNTSVIRKFIDKYLEAELCDIDVRYNEPMSGHTTFKVGGPADIWLRPHGEAFPAFCSALICLARKEEIPVFILGGGANICYEYATKRYRSNCVNWGIVPFTINENEPFDYSAGDWIYVPGIREAIIEGTEVIPAKVITGEAVRDITLECRGLSHDERLILTEGCLMNYYAAKASGE